MTRSITSSDSPILSGRALDPALRKAAQGFEAVFLRQVIGSMRQAKLSDDILGSEATTAFREMADSRTAEAISSKGQFGIAALIERQLGKGGGK
jgi:peptidoglycan hydrolase FlgJ